MKTIVKVLYGSRLYGTQVATSDTDYKLVYLPDLDELLSGGSMSKNWVEHTDTGKVEYEAFDFRRYVELMLSGQTIGIDLLFSNPSDWVEVSNEWLEFIKHRDKYISKNIMPFIGYARGQALKYGEKGDRLRTVIDFKSAVDTYVVGLTKSLTYSSQLSLPPTPEFWSKLVQDFKDRDGVKLKSETKNGVTVEMIEVVGKTFGNTTSIKLWLDPLKKLHDSFGKRANQAMETDGHDLKAQYHCLRIIEEANELLLTGHVTFPRPEKDLLLSIRKGELSKSEVEKIVTERLANLEESLKITKLPEKPLWSDFAMEEAKAAIKAYIFNTQM